MNKNRFILGVLVLSASVFVPGFSARAQGPQPATVADALPAGAVARLGTSLLRHGDGVTFAAYLPDGKRLLSASRDGTIRLWELPSGREIQRFVAPTRALGADPMSSQVTPGIMPPASGKPAAPVRPNEPVTLSPDGKWVAAARHRALWIWEVASGKLQCDLAAEADISELAFSSDSASLCGIGSDRSVTFWQSREGKVIKRVRPAAAEGKIANDPFSSIAVLSADLKYLAWQQVKPPFQRYIVKVVDLETNMEPFGEEVAAGPVMALSFSADGRALISAPADGSLQVVDLATRKDLFRGGRSVPPAPAKSVTLSAKGKRLGVIRATGAAEVWDIETKKRLLDVPVAKPPELPGLGLVSALLRLPSLDGVVAFSPDGRSAAIATGESAAMRLYDLSSGTEIKSTEEGHHTPVSVARLSRDGKSVLTFARGEVLSVWNRESRKIQTRIPLIEGASRVAVSGDGRHLAAASGATVVVLDAANGQLIRRFEAKDLGLPSKEIGVAALALSPEGKILATRSVAGPDIRLWDVATGKAIRTLSQAVVAGAAATPPAANDASGVITLDLIFSPDGQHLAGAGAKWQLCLWEVKSGRIAWDVAFPSGQSVERFAFSASGSCLAALYARGMVAIYETATGRLRTRLAETAGSEAPPRMAVSLGGASFAMFRPADQKACLAFAPNGRHLAVSTRSGGIVLWDLVRGREAGRLEGHQGAITSLEFTSDGRHLLSGGIDTSVLVWDVIVQPEPNTAATAKPQLDAPDRLWEELASADPAKAFAAARQFALARGQMAEVFGARAHPATLLQPGRVQRLVTDLGGEAFAARKSAEAELIALGDQAEPDLRKVLENEPSVDLRQRVERILEAATGRNGGAAIRDLRAVELLEMAGGDECLALLRKLSQGDAPSRVTQAAKAALVRCNEQRRPR